MKKIFAALLVSIVSVSSFAQKTVKVEAEYTYVVPENTTLEQAKQTALDRAKIQAVADEFGSWVTQNNSTLVETLNGASKTHFQSIGGSEVKGEWIETIGDPFFNVSYEQSMLMVSVKVKGIIREITGSQIDLKVQVLCNGIDQKCERTDFKNNDDLYLRFQSPTDGYLVVYLVDPSTEKAYCLLPYSQSTNSAQKIVHDRSYIFFSSKDAPADSRDEVDEYTLTCSGTMERNDLYVVFSPNEFVKANQEQAEENLPRELAFPDFNRWLAKVRTRDDKMQLKTIILTIKQ